MASTLTHKKGVSMQLTSTMGGAENVKLDDFATIMEAFMTRELYIPEAEVRAVLESEDIEGTLATKVIDGPMPVEVYEPLRSVLSATEGLLNFEDRIEVLKRMRDKGEIPEAVYDVVVSVFLDEDVGKNNRIIAARALEYGARHIAKEYRGKEIPQDVLDRTRRETRSFTYDVFAHLRGKIGRQLFRFVEHPDREERSPSEDFRVASILFNDEQAGFLESGYELYRVLHEKVGFNVSNRVNGEPLFTFHNAFEIVEKAREWVGLVSNVSEEERKKYGRYIKMLEDFILKRDKDTRRTNFIQTRRVTEEKEQLLRKATAEVLAINEEVKKAKLDGLSFERVTEELRAHQRELRGRMRGIAEEIVVSSSPPLVRALVEELMKLDEFCRSIDREIALQGGIETDTVFMEHPDASLEARAVVIDLQAREFEAYQTILTDRMLRVKDPHVKEKIAKQIKWAQNNAARLFGLAEELRGKIDE